MTVSPGRLRAALDTAVDHLVGQMNPEGFWQGELSSSALSTATAVSAMSVAGIQGDRPLIDRGVSWLLTTQNRDGGWGDTVDSPSNLSTTLLVRAALVISGSTEAHHGAISRCEQYLAPLVGTGESKLVSAIHRIYGDDRTFAVPIMANCALAGLLPWAAVPSLPFELSVLPRGLYGAMKLHVVSYALPALIAMGLAIHHHSAAGSRLRRFLRDALTGPALHKLEQIQPSDGGFLEATPLTSFVAMSLCSAKGVDHPVVRKCLSFIRESQRSDGSWPIDTNLSVWLTTGAVNALDAAGSRERIDHERTRQWLTNRQQRSIHPYTGAAPGSVAWTDLPGGVPDADDTSGAVLAWSVLGERDAVPGAVEWLLGIQNADGGWPAFCRGWGRLPFDRSSPDITAHALRALRAFDPAWTQQRYRKAVTGGFRYLARSQDEDGSWSPLWFGNQYARDGENRVFGTARSLLAYAAFDRFDDAARAGEAYLLRTQNGDGGWGGAGGLASSIEETALALTALCRVDAAGDRLETVDRAISYLASRVEDGSWTSASPIGLYFSSLWYSEKLYPIIWTAEALGRALRYAQMQENRISDVCNTQA